MQIILGQNHITKTCNIYLFIHLKNNHSKTINHVIDHCGNKDPPIMWNVDKLVWCRPKLHITLQVMWTSPIHPSMKVSSTSSFPGTAWKGEGLMHGPHHHETVKRAGSELPLPGLFLRAFLYVLCAGDPARCTLPQAGPAFNSLHRHTP